MKDPDLQGSTATDPYPDRPHPEGQGNRAARGRDCGISSIVAVILNYRTPDLTVDCLKSLVKSREGEWPALRAIVVDNASGDGSDALIEAAIQNRGWSEWARVIRAPGNRGFSAGNNIGITAEPADAYLLLNSDTIVRPGSVSELCAVLCERPEVDIVSPRLEWPDGTPQQSCFRDLVPLTELISAAATGPLSKLFPSGVIALPVSEVPLEPAWTSFACVLIRGQTFKRVGLMDEDFFMYFEDIDFCRRTRQAGGRILHWPAARVVHLRGKSGSVKADTAARKRRPSYYYAARAHYFNKHHGKVGFWLGNAFWTAGRAVSWIREVVGQKAPHVCQREWLDNWTAGSRVPGG
jgi:GT2 family glycosyltransferase